MTIGIFDSGFGGLTVFKAISEAFPNRRIVYFGDTARFPYGTKSTITVVRYALENTQFLVDQGAELVVVACNTATACALHKLQQSFAIPVIGVIEGAVQTAVDLTRTGRIGVIATNRTIEQNSYQKAILERYKDVEVFSYACPLLVSAIEDGSVPHAIVQSILSHYLQPLKERSVDTLILGCTHFPLVSFLIEKEMGTHVHIVDPAVAIAKSLSRQIQNDSTIIPEHAFFVSDDPARFKKIGEIFLGQKMQSISFVKSPS